jgi:aldehyde dehydrogenase (NAD+)
MKVIESNHNRSWARPQRMFFNEGKTRSIAARKKILKLLKEVILVEENSINEALSKDLGKSTSETFLSELGLVITEIDYFIRHLSQLAEPKRVKSSLLNWPSKDYIVPEPYGVMLHISPWNYPFQLVFTPLIGAVAAGNTVVVKPSELAPHTANCIENIIKLTFPPEWVTVVQGGPEIGKSLLEERWDYIMYTGGVRVAKIVAQAAAEHLTPTMLELGGKNPCIVDQTASIKVAARRIVFGKFLNCGQTCIAPDYVLVHASVKQPLIEAMIDAIKESYGTDQSISSDYGRIIDDRHFSRLQKLLHNQKIHFGGKTNNKKRYIQPTLIALDNIDNPLMEEEIFGPLLPIISYQKDAEFDAIIQRYEKPLSFYVFSQRSRWSKSIMHRFSYGGGIINDTLLQFTNRNLPFGGVGKSGMGAYHGKHSFFAFSHNKPFIKRRSWPDPSLRYAPYQNQKKMSILKKFVNWLG